MDKEKLRGTPSWVRERIEEMEPSPKTATEVLLEELEKEKHDDRCFLKKWIEKIG